jgi:predicted MPP superfamily phosphohydrolase
MMRNSPFWWIFIGFMVLLDFYVFQAIKLVSQSAGGKTRMIIFTSYWVLSVLAVATLVLLPYLHFDNQSKLFKSTIFAIIIGLFLAKLIAGLFFLIDDIRRFFQWGVSRLFSRKSTVTEVQEDEKIGRSVFLSWVGLIAGGGLFSSLLYGFGNKYKYQLKNIQLAFSNLPNEFKGFKIVQISDVHSGSFTNKDAVLKGIEMIMAQKPDLIVFTGDLVNNTAEEMVDYMDVFSRLKAPMGVYSVLGNHDYGDYAQWDKPETKTANLQTLKNIHQQLGWRLLINEHVVLEKNAANIALIGVENWSAKARFPKYGDMKKAHAGTEAYPFKILLSHDPSHWDAEVRKNFGDVDLMLSGHTHGMQFGVEIPGFKWSPVQYMYKQWAGLYEEGAQKLYINRGFGFIGYPGRVGILPEITVLELA